MEVIESVKSLEIIILEIENGKNLIHHSDRGTRYCSGKCAKLLQDCYIKIRMTETGGPLDNAIAERVNGILKEEYLECYLVTSFQGAIEL
ncbi:hypothetical protein [Elizabethkingia meningoseptica]|uniref:hypothetical protein n=1 Tax=Elizabethkingia meningoseptica TaxID=238 RepID=UPI0023B027AC|nr:hypothetical protein [Elizabethkingia meningoseptica]